MNRLVLLGFFVLFGDIIELAFAIAACVRIFFFRHKVHTYNRCKMICDDSIGP